MHRAEVVREPRKGCHGRAMDRVGTWDEGTNGTGAVWAIGAKRALAVELTR